MHGDLHVVADREHRVRRREAEDVLPHSGRVAVASTACAFANVTAAPTGLTSDQVTEAATGRPSVGQRPVEARRRHGEREVLVRARVHDGLFAVATTTVTSSLDESCAVVRGEAQDVGPCFAAVTPVSALPAVLKVTTPPLGPLTSVQLHAQPAIGPALVVGGGAVDRDRARREVDGEIRSRADDGRLCSRLASVGFERA